MSTTAYRLLGAAVFGVIAVSALHHDDDFTFVSQQGEANPHDLRWEHTSDQSHFTGHGDESQYHLVDYDKLEKGDWELYPGGGKAALFPGQHKPKKSDETILTVLRDNPAFSRFFKVANISDEIVSLLNDSSISLTLFAPPNHAIPKPPPHRRHIEKLEIEQLYREWTLAELVTEVESIDFSGDNDEARSRLPREVFKKIITAIISYHILPERIHQSDLTKNVTYATKLLGPLGSLDGEPLRLRVGPAFPIGVSINFFSKIFGPEIEATNGIIHHISRPLLPPPSIFQEVFLLQRAFATFTSSLQRTGLTDAVDYRLIRNEDSLLSTKGSPVTTVFAPTNNAFAKLPKKLQFFLFSPLGERVLKKILQYHVLPNVTIHSDWIYNSTSVNAVNSFDEEEASDTIYDDDRYGSLSVFEHDCLNGLGWAEAEIERKALLDEFSYRHDCGAAHHVPGPPSVNSCRRRDTPSPKFCSERTFHGPSPPPLLGTCMTYNPGHGHQWGRDGSRICPRDYAHAHVQEACCQSGAPPCFDDPHAPPPRFREENCVPLHLHRRPEAYGVRYRYHDARSQYEMPLPRHPGGIQKEHVAHECPFSRSYCHVHEGAGRIYKSASRPFMESVEKFGHINSHPPRPRLDFANNLTVSTALANHTMNVVVVKFHIRIPLPGQGKIFKHVSRLLVNRQPVKVLDGVAWNGAVHVVDKLISPRPQRGRSGHGPSHAAETNSRRHSVYDVYDAEENDIDDWEDWESWLLDWAEQN